jgi:hypothetical protein
MTHPREASPDDVAEVAALLDAKRQEYVHYSPLFWRPAVDASTKHQLFLQALIVQDGPITLVQPGRGGLDGMIFSLRRADDWLVDDFTVRAPELWMETGRRLLDEVRRRIGDSPLTVVCGQRDEPKRAMLRHEGGRLRDEWWVHLLADVGTSAREPSGASGRIITAPPVYDPGGPVCQVQEWDGSRVALDELERWAHAQGAVLTVVSVKAEDDDRQELLDEAGYHVASEWYRFGPPDG